MRPQRKSNLRRFVFLAAACTAVALVAVADRHWRPNWPDEAIIRTAPSVEERADRWVRRFVPVDYARHGADAGSAMLQRELEVLYPAGIEASRLIETLMKAGFDCGSYFSSRTWRGCHVEATNFWGALAVIRVKVDGADGVVARIFVDMSF